MEATMEHAEIDVNRIRVILGRRALVKWEEAPRCYSSTNDSMKQGGILRPEKTKRAYYTGVVLKCGLDLTDEIEEGDRVFFQQFSGFGQYSDRTHGRMALVEESAIECIIPPREEGVSVEDGGEYE